jgi:mono/diheme cytochrome c family protein
MIRILALACVMIATAAQAQTPEGLFGNPSHFTEPTGEAVYRGICAGCHMPAGQGAIGAAAYPALAQNPRLAVSAYPILRVLRGKGAMPGFAGTLSNQQIADIVAFIRQNFGNADPGPVTPEQVQSLR